jgi:hypothetical protein
VERCCAFCGKPVNPASRLTWHRVVGWERHASIRVSGKHGGSDIVFREPRDEYAHDGCIQLEKAGVSVAQESLL